MKKVFIISELIYSADTSFVVRILFSSFGNELRTSCFQKTSPDAQISKKLSSKE